MRFIRLVCSVFVDVSVIASYWRNNLSFKRHRTVIVNRKLKFRRTSDFNIDVVKFFGELFKFVLLKVIVVHDQVFDKIQISYFIHNVLQLERWASRHNYCFILLKYLIAKQFLIPGWQTVVFFYQG